MLPVVEGLGIYVSKVDDRSRGWREGSFFDSYYTKSATPFLGLLHFTRTV